MYDPQALNSKNLKKFQFYIEFPDRFIQIMHVGNLHWFTIANIKSSHSTQIQAYDSLFMNTTYINNQKFNAYLKKIILPPKCEINNNEMGNKRINEFAKIKDELIEIECSIESVQKQSDNVMCGLFSIAFACDLCLDIDPSLRHYDETKMREHLLKCLNQGYFEEFPQISDPHKNRVEKSDPQIILIEM